MKKLGAHLPRLIYAPLALLPFAYLVSMVARHAVNVPYLDDWELVPLLSKLDGHVLRFRDLWEQHNEHRLVIPQAIMLAMAKLTSWNVRYEMGLSIVLAVATFVVFMRQVEATSLAVKSRWLALVGPAVAVLVFSFSQYQNWLWGWQFQMYLNALAVTGSIVLLAKPPFAWPRFVASMALGVVALYSFANGMLIWPIGAGIIAFAPHFRDRGLRVCLGTWTAVGAVAAASYLYGYQTPPNNPPLSYVFGHPREFVDYVFNYLGGPAGPLPDVAWDAGVAITLITVASAIVLVRFVRFPVAQLLPYFGLCAYVFTSALLTGVGRVRLGSGQALASRYNTYTALLWSSALVLLALIASSRAAAVEPQPASRGKGRATRKPEASGGRPIALAVAAAAAMLWICVRTGKTSLDRRENFVKLSQFQSRAGDLLRAHLSPEAPPLVKQMLLYPDETKMVDRAKYLQKEHLSLFHDQDETR